MRDGLDDDSDLICDKKEAATDSPFFESESFRQ